MNDEWRDEVSRIRQYLDDHVCNIRYICELSPIFHVHCNLINSRFRKAYGIPPKKYLSQKKIEILIDYARTNGNGECAYHYSHMLGYKDDSGLCKLLKRELDMTFSEFMKKYTDD